MKPWLDGDGYTVTIRGTQGTFMVRGPVVPWEVVSIVTGIPLVDLSLEWEDHLIRGTQ